jgi:hypothetical protein
VPKLAVDIAGNPVKRDVLSGRAEILQYEREPDVWVYRQLIKGSKKYIRRKLGAMDLLTAMRQAEDLYLALQAELDEEGQPLLGSHTIEAALKRWVKINEERQSTGLINTATLDAKVGVLTGPVLMYLTTFKKLKTISQIKIDTFLEYRHWRVTEGWKHIESSRGKVIPKDSTVKRDIVHIKDWFSNFLHPRGYTTVIPTLEKIKITKDQLDANPPIPLQPDWKHVYEYLEDWAKAGEKHPNPRVAYFRQLFRHFVLISYNAGTRPSELVGKIEKRRIYAEDGSVSIVSEIIGGIKWEDVEVYEADHTTPSGKTFKFNEATIYIRRSKTGESREVPCNTGDFFIRWREIVDKFRKQNGLPPVDPKKDYVFFNPFTDRPYPYSQIARCWSDLREELGDKLQPIRTDQQYTLYSLRSSYITNQINEGKDIYLVKKITGHSLETLNRHYDRSDVKKRRAEATARTYGKPEQDTKRVDLEKLPKEDKSTKKPSQRTRVVTVARNSRSRAKKPATK